MRPPSYIHYRHLISRALKGKIQLSDIYEERIEVSASERGEIEPSIFLSDNLQNITCLHPETDSQHEHLRIYGGKHTHDSVEAYCIRDVRLKNASLYKQNWSRHYPYIKSRNSVELCGERPYALSSTYSGIQYFGHWLRDDLTTSILAREFADAVCLRTPSDWPHYDKYLDYFELESTVIDGAFFNSLYIFKDCAQNSHKVERYRQLRKQLRRKVPFSSPRGSEVYLRRGSGGANKRIVSNEADMIAALKKKGFVIVDLERDDLSNVIAALMNASLVITIEGSNADHVLYTLASGGGLLCIVPPMLFNNAPKDWINELKMHYAFLVGEADGERFKVNLRDLLTVTDKIRHVVSTNVGKHEYVA